MTRPVDLRVIYDLNKERLSVSLTSRDLLLVPNLFSDFAPHEIYQKLVDELCHCGVDEGDLFKLWHGDSHLIADDHTAWKKNAPTFRMIVDRIRNYFQMDIKATRFNWYKDTSQWKPFHHDAAAVKKDKALTQNFTVALSFGATRQAGLEEVDSKKVISLVLPDGSLYAFCTETNILWKHGILQEPLPVREEGRISVICWGWIDGMVKI